MTRQEEEKLIARVLAGDVNAFEPLVTENQTKVYHLALRLLGNEADAADVFGIVGEGSDVEKGKLDKNGYVSVAEQLTRRFGCKKVAITLRTSQSAFDNKWAGMLYTGGKAYFSPEYQIHIVDRVGGGDSFGGALIYALAKGMKMQDAINFAVAASCLKHSIEHDFNLVSVAEVEALAAGGGTGRVQR